MGSIPNLTTKIKINNMTTQTKYRIKTLSEIAKDYTADSIGNYQVGATWFNTSAMSHLCGVELTDYEASQILSLDEGLNFPAYATSITLNLQNGPADKFNNWSFSKGMITEIKTTKKSYLKDMKVNKHMQIRINNIECRESQGRYEIIKWRPNPYYNELHAYLLDGWHEEDGFVRRNHTSIQRDIFDRKETCFVIADLVINHREPDINLHSIGSRLLDLSKEDRNDFFKVYELSAQMIGEKLFGVDDKEEF